MKKLQICDTTLIGRWEDVQGIEASTITHNPTDTEKLDGLLVYGYETKYNGKTNANRERYAVGSPDRFIKEYFVENKLNIPADVEHSPDPDWLIGRCVYCESTNTGFYCVVYIPRADPKFVAAKVKIENGILQGFSKYGWSVDYDWVADKKEPGGGYWLVRDVEITKISLVSTPANAVRFERVKETKNATRFVSNHDEPESNTPKIFRKKAKA